MRLSLVRALVALAAVQFLHLIDSLRTADNASFPGVFAEPQAIAGIGGSLLAAAAVSRGWPSGLLLSRVAGSLVGLGFLVSHGLPWESARTEPYWGEGSADVLQWLGVLVILALCVTCVSVSRRVAPWRVAPGDTHTGTGHAAAAPSNGAARPDSARASRTKASTRPDHR